MNSINNRKMFVRMLVLVGLGALAIMVLGSAGATITGDAPPATGDWVVNSATVVTGEMVYVDGNLTVNGNLDLRDSTLVMNVTTPWQYDIEVRSTGRITATDTTFSSNHTVAGYGFRVWGRIDLLRCHVTQTEDGLRILTDGAQSIVSTLIDDFHLGGLYLEGADGTTLTDVTVQSDRFETFRTYDFVVRESGQREHFVVPDTSAFQIKGGKPTIDGLTISVNGSYMLEGNFDFHPDKVSTNLMLLFPNVALIETDQVLDVQNLLVRDCALGVHTLYNVHEHTTLATGKHAINNQYHVTPVLFHDSAGAHFSDAMARDVRLGTTSNSYTTDGGIINANEANQGTWAITVLSTEVLDDTDVRAIDLEVVDSTFLRLGAINVYTALISTNATLAQVALDMRVDSVRVEECPIGGAIQVANAPIFMKDQVGRFEISVTNSSFTANAGSLVDISLSEAARPYRGIYPASPSTAWAYIYDNITVSDNHVYSNFGAGFVIGGGGTARLADEMAKSGKGGTIHAHMFEFAYIERNLFEDHDGTTGPVAASGVNNPHKGLERIFVRYNTFRDSNTATGSPTLIQLTGKDFVRVENNTFIDNLKSTAIKVNTNGGDDETPEPADVVIADNTFIGNRFWHNNENNMGMMIINVGGDVTITRNTVTGDESRAFVNIMESPQFSGYADFIIRDNEITDSPGMSGIVYLRNFNVYHSLLTVIVEDNLVRDCGVAPLMDYYDFGPDLDAYDYDAKIVVRDNTVINATEEVIRAHGDIEIRDNVFTNCRGYIINLQYLNEHIPVISGNDFTDCRDLVYLGSKAKCIGGLTVTIEDMDLDCTGNALRFSNMQVVMNNMVVSYTSDPAVIAENSVVSIVGGDIEEGSGRMIGLGSITRYHVLEAHVTWENAASVGSGMPAVGVPVMLLDSEGRLAITRETDDEGSLGSVLVPAWTVRSMFVTRHTPHTMLIGASGIAKSIDLVFDHDFVGEDALEISLLDDRIPVVAITAPVSGQHFRSDTVTLTGFVLEMGSGIDWIHITVDDGSPVDVTTDRSGTFSQDVTGLGEGTVKLTLAAKDVAGNLQSRDILVKIDRTPPDIEVVEPDPGLITSGSTVHLDVLMEPDNTVYVNGHPMDVEVTGRMTVDWPLTEGENIILIKAVDAAGNSATETITVTRDSMVPKLLLLGPQDDLLTSDPSVTVWGETEPGMEVWLLVLDGATELQNVSIDVGADGTFSGTVDMEEGTFDLLLVSRDDAMNVASAQVIVTVDTTPPGVTITSPTDGTLSRGGTVQVTATADADAHVLVNGAPVDNDGSIAHTLQLDEGMNTIQVIAMDAAGNAATTSVTVTVDSVPPTVMMTSPLSEHITISTQTLTVNGMVSGAPATLTVMGDDVTVTDGEFTKTVTLAEEGMTMITIRATDAAGNFHEVHLTVDADWTPPTLDIDRKKDAEEGKAVLVCTVMGDCVQLLVTHTSASGEASHTIMVEGDGTYTVLCDLEKGDNTIVVRAVDAHGGFTEAAPVNVEYSPEAAEEEEGGWGAFEVGVIMLALGLAIVLTVLVMGWYAGRRQE